MRKCLVIAAGRGSRLASGGLPKPLFRVLGLPLIERAIVTAKRAGLEDFTVVTGHQGARVREFLDRLALRRGIAVTHVVNEKWEGGNGLSVLAAREVIGDEPFALLMADHVVDLPLLSELLTEPLEAGGVCLAVDRNLSQQDLKDLIDNAPMPVKRAQELGLIDDVNYEDSLAYLLADNSAGKSAPDGDGEDETGETVEKPPKARLTTWSGARQLLMEKARRIAPGYIGVVSIEGNIVMGSSRQSPMPFPLPFVGGATAGAQSLTRLLRRYDLVQISGIHCFTPGVDARLKHALNKVTLRQPIPR